MSDRYDAAQVEAALRLLHPDGEVFEIRMPKTGRTGTVSGYFRDPALAAQAIARYDGRVPAVYVTLNPVHPDLHSLYCDRLQERAESTTEDKHIVRRRWLLIDVDAERTSPKISATEAELKAALDVAGAIREYLCGVRHWPEPIMVMSGNGAHLLFPIDLPNDETSKQNVADVLAALDVKYSTDQAHVDTSVFNAARICKLPGTMACKGDSTTERPHRRSHILQHPEVL